MDEEGFRVEGLVLPSSKVRRSKATHDNHADEAVVSELPIPVDWVALFAREIQGEDWLVDDFWPARRAISIVARYKSGKSLLLFYVAACLARGIDPWSRAPRSPITVGYWDMEMTEDDLHERALDFGLDPDDLERFKYYLLPDVPPLDTPEGGKAVLSTLKRDGVEATVFDTIGRVVEGEENTSDTINAYYRNTALHLKAEGIASARLDHTGHTNPNRARGSSGKGADVDVAWVLKREEGSNVSQLDHHGITRVRWVPRTLTCTLVEGSPDIFERSPTTWPAGVTECAAALEKYGVPLDFGRDKARQVLVDAGADGHRNDVLSAAIKFRRYESERRQLLPKTCPGQVSATPSQNLSRTGQPEIASEQDGDRSRDRSGQVPSPSVGTVPPLKGGQSSGTAPEPDEEPF